MFVPNAKNYIESVKAHQFEFEKAHTQLTNWMNRNNLGLSDKNFNETFLDKRRDSSEKIAFYADENNLIILNDLCNCENIQLNEVLFRYPMGLELRDGAYIFEIVEETLQLIIPFGIPQHSVELHKWKWHRKFDAEPKRPQVFTLDSLLFGFVLWLIACEISILWFLIELIKMETLKQSKSLVGLVLLIRLIKSRLNTYK